MTCITCNKINRSFAFVLAVGLFSVPALGQWPQFGGPNRNFMADSKGLAEKWPEGGPKKLWERDLGDGYSTIVADDGLLFTMYRVGEDEFSIALDAKTGKTVWEHKHPSPSTEVMNQFGPGPHTTPTVDGVFVYTIGTNGMLNAFEKKSGAVIWSHDLVKEYNGFVPDRGYGSSPIVHKDALIVVVDHPREDEDAKPKEGEPKKNTAGGISEAQTIVAFNKKTGDPTWTSQDLPVGYASPVLIKFDGQDQLVFVLQKDFIGLNADTGELLWRHELKPEGANITTPVFDGKDTLFVSSAYDSGSRAIKLTRKDGRIVPEELWYSRKMRVHHGNVIRLDDHLYGSSGDFGPAFFMAINLKTGETAWRERGFTKANCVHADGKLILLDEDGQLALVTVDPKGMKILSQAKVAERYAWAAPTLVDKTLYVRDRKKIMALDLSATSG
jgi:outer membrane protein assembly factor BamB